MIAPVYMRERMFEDGATHKNINAGPIPPPLKYIPAEIGITVQEQTARKIEENAATGNEIIFFVLIPKYFKIVSFERNVTIPPASKKAGIRHVRTCNAIYSLRARIPESKSFKKNCI
jgi:hypothetical protein